MQKRREEMEREIGDSSAKVCLWMGMKDKSVCSCSGGKRSSTPGAQLSH